MFFCYGDEENGHRARTYGHLTTADQSEIRKAYLVSVWLTSKGIFDDYIKRLLIFRGYRP